jgi:plasmid stabilization system protein ParE
MAFEVRTTPEAERDAIEILDWLMKNHAGDTGLRWFQRMDEAIDSLAELPHRCKFAEETKMFPFEVRELLYGRKPHVYRILFTIDGNTVYILHVRHGRRLMMTSN